MSSSRAKRKPKLTLISGGRLSDIVGPLPVCKDSGNRYILTVLDLCTHYPEAIDLKQHTAQDVAQALVNVFSHFGFPQEILSDQGSDFMSALMQIFLNDFGICQIHASPYHQQTNGACERFNGTMKTMLRSLTEFSRLLGHSIAMGPVRVSRSTGRDAGLQPIQSSFLDVRSLDLCHCWSQLGFKKRIWEVPRELWWSS